MGSCHPHLCSPEHHAASSREGAQHPSSGDTSSWGSHKAGMQPRAWALAVEGKEGPKCTRQLGLGGDGGGLPLKGKALPLFPGALLHIPIPSTPPPSIRLIYHNPVLVITERKWGLNILATYWVMQKAPLLPCYVTQITAYFTTPLCLGTILSVLVNSLQVCAVASDVNSVKSESLTFEPFSPEWHPRSGLA